MYVATLGKNCIGSDRKSPILGIGVPNLRKPGLGVRWRRTFFSISGRTFCASGFTTDGLFSLSFLDLSFVPRGSLPTVSFSISGCTLFCASGFARRTFFSITNFLFCASGLAPNELRNVREKYNIDTLNTGVRLARGEVSHVRRV